MNKVILSPGYFPDPSSSRSLSNADIYVGEVDLDPEIPANQKTVSVLQENGTIVAVSQPIKTGLGGTPVYNGSPATLLVDGQYSLKVVNSFGAQVYYTPINYIEQNIIAADRIIPVAKNIAGLRAYSPPPVDGTINPILGYTVDGDGGGGNFVWDSDSVLVDNNGTIIQITGVVTGRWIRQLNGFVTPEMFGPNTTPGTTDMTAEIQAAVDFAYTQKGTVVFFGPNIYAVSATINFYAGATNLQGSGNFETSYGTRIRWIGGNNDSVFYPNESNIIRDMFIYNGNASTGVTAIDMNRDVAGVHATHTTIENVHCKSFAIGIDMEYTWYNSFDQVTASYCTTGYKFGTETNNMTFDGCHANNCGTGILVSGTISRAIVWTAPSIESSTAYGIDITGGPINWKFIGGYYEANAQTARLKGTNIEFDNSYINLDVLGFEFIGANGIRIKDTTFPAAMDASDAFIFTGDLTSTSSYVKNSVTLQNNASRGFVAQAIATYPNLILSGVLNVAESSVVIRETDRIDASSAYSQYYIPFGIGLSTWGKRLAMVALSVETTIVVPTTFTVRAGSSAPDYDQYVNTEYTGNVSGGIYNLALVPAALPVINPGTYTYRINNTATSSGLYRMIFVIAD